MKELFLSFLVTLAISALGQRINPHAFEVTDEFLHVMETGNNLSNDTAIDITHYHIDIEVALDSAFISGEVTIGMFALVDGLHSIKLDLDSAYTISNISYPADSFVFVSNILDITLKETYNSGDYMELSIQYEGVPVLAGGYKGLRYETHDEDEIIIATLSTPYLAHTWWPCKDGTQDKADSVFVDITIKDTIVNGHQVVALSNGVLDSVFLVNGRRTFAWKHRYPIVPYYVMMAISNYTSFSQQFIADDYTFPIDYYVFESHYDDAVEGVALLPEAIQFFTDIFGPYPFRDEKYAMTQLGYYGAIENQTNTITNNMSENWFFVSVHELAHMWFADMITCNTWHHGWLNEGFASYSEALFSEYKYGNYDQYIEQFEFFQSGTVYLDDVSNPFDVFKQIIYDKGAFILHMLRGVLGDDDFFEVIYQYANDDQFIYNLATTEEFQSVCEDISGKDLEYFFDQWIYDEWYPMYYYNYIYEPESNKLYVAINQVQEYMGYREVFEMPLEIGVKLSNGNDTILQVYNNEKNAYYTFDFYEDVDNVVIDPNNWVLNTSALDPNIVVGVSKPLANSIIVYPNPSEGSFDIRTKFNSNEYKLFFYDILGNPISKYEYTRSNNLIKVTGLTSGAYFLHLQNDDREFIEKVIVN